MIFTDHIDSNNHITATYFMESETTLADAAWNLAIGQSVGNPNVRNEWETDELFELYSAKILCEGDELQNLKSGVVKIAFPCDNIDIETDGISQLLCFLMGGQLDIDIIKKCHLIDIDLPPVLTDKLKGPYFGLSGMRKLTNTYDKPLFGGIIKPKTGINSDVLLDMVKQMVDGGVNFIKEDEILGNPSFCRIKDRVPKIMNYLRDKNVIYSVCINSDPLHVLDRVRSVHEMGGNSVHVNVWSGLGVYKSIRDLDLPIFIHFQKSGDKAFTNASHDYHIDWHVICKIASYSGVDSIHAGMFGGYLNDEKQRLLKTLTILRDGNVVPALSCGMHPGLIKYINDNLGVDYMANVGGALHGHPDGTYSGCLAMRQAIDNNFGEEYNKAILKWGLRC